MADATLAQVTVRVLEKLFVLVGGDTAEAEDVATVEKVIANVNEELRENELCYWSDSATPQYLVEYLSAYYACFLANDFMSAQEAMAFRQDHFNLSLTKIRELTATKKRISEPTRGTYF